MEYDYLNDQKIEELIKIPKTIINPDAKARLKGKHEELNYDLIGENNNKFRLYIRQNTMEGLEDDFSCGLSLRLSDGDYMTLIRCNGSSHTHQNIIEKTKIGYDFHIHKATETYIYNQKKVDGFAEKTDKYTTKNDALIYLIQNCNITGLDIFPEQKGLFE